MDQQQAENPEAGQVRHAAPADGVHGPNASRAGDAPAVAGIFADAVDLTANDVSEFLIALDKCIRARRLYAPNNPAYNAFLGTVKATCAGLWDRARSLSLVVDEHAFKWQEHAFTPGEGRDNLAFQFYKDGVRALAFLPGFEDEIEPFLDVVVKARQIDQTSADDMVTLLWEREFTALQYSYVDVLSEGLEVPDAGPLTIDTIDLSLIAEDKSGPVSYDPYQQPYAVQQGAPPVARTVSRDDFSETLYFLEPRELDHLREELDKEWKRDIKRDVINALFDRLEDSGAHRQTEILSILQQLLPAYLASGDLTSASLILVELNRVLSDGSALPDSLQAEAQDIFGELSKPVVLQQLLQSIEDGAIDPSGEELTIFLRYLRPEALAPLLLITETTRVATLRDRLRGAIAAFGREHPQVLLDLLASDDELIVAGAVRAVGQNGMATAVAKLAVLLQHASAIVRRAVVDALVQLRSGAALDALQQALDDSEREVRIGAARGIGSLRYQPARSRLESMLQSRTVRETDLTEQIAFFEAYGAVANTESVELLDRMLNGKKLFAKQTPELRSCAALALGKVGSPASRKALERAVDDANPMVRSAVLKALRQEGVSA